MVDAHSLVFWVPAAVGSFTAAVVAGMFQPRRWCLSAVRPSQVKAWVARLRADGMEASYIYALHSRLSQILSDAVHDGVLGRSPCSRRTSPPMGKPKVYLTTTEQVWAIRDAVPDHLRVAVLLGAFAGLRVAEVSALRVTDVDFIRGVVHPKTAVAGQATEDRR